MKILESKMSEIGIITEFCGIQNRFSNLGDLGGKIHRKYILFFRQNNSTFQMQQSSKVEAKL
jgi:hypothetical protein